LGIFFSIEAEIRAIASFFKHGYAILQTICAKKGSGCWRWPGSNSFYMHHLSIGKFLFPYQSIKKYIKSTVPVKKIALLIKNTPLFKMLPERM